MASSAIDEPPRKVSADVVAPRVQPWAKETRFRLPPAYKTAGGVYPPLGEPASRAGGSADPPGDDDTHLGIVQPEGARGGSVGSPGPTGGHTPRGLSGPLGEPSEWSILEVILRSHPEFGTSFGRMVQERVRRIMASTSSPAREQATRLSGRSGGRLSPTRQLEYGSIPSVDGGSGEDDPPPGAPAWVGEPTGRKKESTLQGLDKVVDKTQDTVTVAVPVPTETRVMQEKNVFKTTARLTHCQTRTRAIQVCRPVP